MVDHQGIDLEGKSIGFGFHSTWNVWDVVYCNWFLPQSPYSFARVLESII